MHHHDLDSILTEAERLRSAQHYPTQSPELRLQPWLESPEHDRFGGYARQIESEVLHSLHRIGG